MFKRSYKIAQDLGNPVVTEDARIQLGIASAHHVLSGLCSTMNDLNKNNLQKILDFKSVRQDAFLGGLNGTIDESNKEDAPGPNCKGTETEGPGDELKDEISQESEQPVNTTTYEDKPLEDINNEQVIEPENNDS